MTLHHFSSRAELQSSALFSLNLDIQTVVRFGLNLAGKGQNPIQGADPDLHFSPFLALVRGRLRWAAGWRPSLLQGHRSRGVIALATTFRGDLWTGSRMGTIRVWSRSKPGELPDGRLCRELRREQGGRAHMDQLLKMALSSCGEVVWSIGLAKVKLASALVARQGMGSRPAPSLQGLMSQKQC